MFNWKSFCHNHSIPVTTTGKSAHKNNIYIVCPWCGTGKPHMGLSLTDTSWGCWKDAWHRGRNPLRLVRALLRVSTAQAQAIIADGGPRAFDYDDLKQQLEQLGTRESAPEQVDEMIPDEAFEHLEKGDPFCRYLVRRGFNAPLTVAETYQLRKSRSGRFKSRLIFPVFVRGRLVGWTGRAITPASIRYLAHGDLKDVLINYDNAAAGGRALLIVEGPLDALKVDFYAAAHGVRAVGMMGTALTPGKTKLLFELSRKFDRVGLLLDDEALAESLRVDRHLTSIGADIYRLEGADDPGAMSRSQVIALIHRVLGDLKIV